MSSPAALAPRRLHPRGSRRPVALAAVLGGALLTSAIADAQACGCLVLSDVSVPTVQAGERILFAQDSGTVTAIIQIQYQGKPGDFGWLVPLPAIPQNRLGQDGIDVSTDELFTQLLKTTGPTYALTSTSTCTSGFGGGGGYGGGYGGGFGCNSASLSGSANEAAYGAADLGSAPPPPPSPLVVQSSVGPYDFAVLKADSQADMLKWLQDNRYVVPTGSDAAVSPYVRPGAYFLALKLRADQTSGDVQPIVLRYKSDYPMVPLTLTSVGAVPNMGIQVWVLGSARAIPRNFYHAVLNDAQLDLLNNAGNYSQVVTAAVAEAPRKHAFITEYAGSSNVMAGTLNRPGRFDRVTELPAISDPYQYVQMALNPLLGFTPVPNYGELALQQSAAALATVLAKYIPEPQSLVARGIPLLTYYQSLDYYLRRDPQRGGPDYDAVALKLQMFDPRAATADLQSRIVIPNQEAQQLFDTHGQLTRLYTTISPEDMNVDPVFGFNPELPAVPLAHRASLAQGCEPYDRTLDTDSGIHVSSWTPADRQLPYSLRIETIGEVGQPVVITNNGTKIRSLSPLDRDPNAGPSGAELQRGCVTTPGRRLPVAAPVSLIVLCSGLVVLRRRRRAPAA